MIDIEKERERERLEKRWWEKINIATDKQGRKIKTFDWYRKRKRDRERERLKKR